MRRATGVLQAIEVGFREWRTVAVLLWANWAVAGLMVAPTLPAVLGAYGHAPRAAGKPLVSSELLFSLGPVLQAGGMPSLGAPLLLLVLLQLLLAGGIAWRASAGGPFRLGAFLGQSGRLLGPNTRLYLWLLLVLPVAAVVPAALAFGMHALGLPTLFTMSSETWIFGHPFGGWPLVHLATVVLALAWWRLALDVGRVLLFREDLRATRRAAWRAVRLVLHAPGAVVGYAVLGAVATLLVLLAARARAVLPEGNAGLALLALGVGQGVLWIRGVFQVAGTRFAATLVEREAATLPATEGDLATVEQPVLDPPAG